MKRFILAIALIITPASIEAQVIGGNTDVSVLSGSGSTAAQLPSSTKQFPALLIVPANGNNTDIRWVMGNSSSVLATSTSPVLPPGGICYTAGAPNNFISTYGVSGTATLHISQLTLCPQSVGFAGGGGGGGGPTANVTIVGPLAGDGSVRTSAGPALVSHVSSASLVSSQVIKGAAGDLLGFICTSITGNAAGYCIAYNNATAPAPGALTAAKVLDTCAFQANSPNGCAFSRIPAEIAYSAGITILVTTATDPLTYTTGTATAFITADFQ